MKRRFKFTIRTLLLLMIVTAIPCCWIAWEVAQHKAERETLAHLQEVNSRMRVVWENQTPKWISKLGINPKWMERVIRVDATGVTCGGLAWEDYPKSQIDFGDEELAQVSKDLSSFESLREIYFQVTKISDDSIDLFAQMKHLQILNLQETDVTHAGADELRNRLPSTDVQHHTAISG